jgi:hypothetical protein
VVKWVDVEVQGRSWRCEVDAFSRADRRPRPDPGNRVGQAHLASQKVEAKGVKSTTLLRRESFCGVNMDFLKSAVASAISKGPAFGYTFGDRVDLNDSIWTLHNGTKRVWPGCLHVNELLLTSVC